MNALLYSQNVNLTEFRLKMTESAIWSEIALSSQGSQDTNNKWACRKPTASLITPIDPPLHPPPFSSISRSYFWQLHSSNGVPGEVGRGPPGRATYEEEDMLRAEVPNDAPGLADASVGSTCWAWLRRCLTQAFSSSSLWCIFHLSVCLHDSPSEYLTLEEGTKPWKGPAMPPGCHCSLRLHTLCFSLRTVYCWNPAQKTSFHFWPPQKHIKMTDVPSVHNRINVWV